MKKVLITNDDGIDAPALGPLTTALGRIARVTVAAPSGERSWIGKAITRVGDVATEQVMRHGAAMWSVDGYPADCVQIGAYGIMDTPPELVVSGINIGSNRGSAFATASGTLGAAVEAANIGIPAIAFSAMSVGDWGSWVRWVHSEEASEMWARLATIAADVVATVFDGGFPPGVDVLSVNLPADATMATPRVVTTLARTRYGRLFAGDNGVYHHEFDGVLQVEGDVDGSDLAALDAGLIAITAIRMASSVSLNGTLRARLERA
jgi:5'/3'-nucleotidase